MFDNSDYQENLPYYCNTNKKIIGKFKDEACGIPITEFVGLKSKMYSYVKDNPFYFFKISASINHRLTSGQDIDPLYFLQNIGLHQP